MTLPDRATQPPDVTKSEIELSTCLSGREKGDALRELARVLEDVASGKTSDFRMIIRGQQRTTHSDSEKVSGRAKELRDRGFYFLRYHPNGSKPTDVSDIIPEDTQGRKSHFAPYPTDLCRIPILRLRYIVSFRLSCDCTGRLVWGAVDRRLAFTPSPACPVPLRSGPWGWVPPHGVVARPTSPWKARPAPHCCCLASDTKR